MLFLLITSKLLMLRARANWSYYVLLYVAQLVDEPIYFFTDDATNVFNQVLICRTEYFKCETIMYDYRKDMMVLVAEYCMSFGTSPASNIAQRLAILITDIVKTNFDEEEDAYMALRKQQLFEKPSGQWDAQDHKDAILGTWWERRKDAVQEMPVYVFKRKTNIVDQ